MMLKDLLLNDFLNTPLPHHKDSFKLTFISHSKVAGLIVVYKMFSISQNYAKF